MPFIKTASSEPSCGIGPIGSIAGFGQTRLSSGLSSAKGVLSESARLEDAQKPPISADLTSMKLRSKIAFATALAAAVISAHGASVLINNHSFETPGQANDGNFVATGSGTGVFNSWNYVVQNGGSFEDFGIENQGGGAYSGAAGGGTPSGGDGINNAFLNQDNSGLFAGIFQNVGSLQANTQYTMTLAIGQRLDRTNGSVEFGLYGATTGATDIWATGTALGTATQVSNTPGSFQDFSVTFTTGAIVSNDLYVAARYTETGANLIQASLDNFRLDATVIPEPSVALLGGFGVLALLRRRRVG
jgi:hypothetical protein